MTYRVRNIAVAVALALLAGMLSLFYVSNYKRHVQNDEKTVSIYVAKRDIPVGTSGADIIKRHLLEPSQVVQRTVVPGAISNPDQVANLVTTAPILAEEQVTLRRFANHTELGPRAQLHGTLRAIEVSGDPAQLLGGTLKSGDHVDLVASFSPAGKDNGAISRNVVRNLLVLGTGAAGSSTVGSTADSGTVLLAASEQRQVQKIWWTIKNADGWSLTLRPVTNATDSPEDIETSTSMAVDGVGAAARTHATIGSPR
jgi:Flp pilus assembly protein CpaB